jgi:hypothetical protein
VHAHAPRSLRPLVYRHQYGGRRVVLVSRSCAPHRDDSLATPHERLQNVLAAIACIIPFFGKKCFLILIFGIAFLYTKIYAGYPACQGVCLRNSRLSAASNLLFACVQFHGAGTLVSFLSGQRIDHEVGCHERRQRLRLQRFGKRTADGFRFAGMLCCGRECRATLPRWVSRGHTVLVPRLRIACLSPLPPMFSQRYFSRQA